MKDTVTSKDTVPIIIENEYGRIMLEQGLIGLFIWVFLIGWFLTRFSIRRTDRWFIGRRLAWYATLAFFGTGLIGMGFLTSIPMTALLLFYVGWVSTYETEEKLVQVSREPIIDTFKLQGSEIRG